MSTNIIPSAKCKTQLCCRDGHQTFERGPYSTHGLHGGNQNNQTNIVHFLKALCKHRLVPNTLVIEFHGKTCSTHVRCSTSELERVESAGVEKEPHSRGGECFAVASSHNVIDMATICGELRGRYASRKRRLPRILCSSSIPSSEHWIRMEPTTRLKQSGLRAYISSCSERQVN